MAVDLTDENVKAEVIDALKKDEGLIIRTQEEDNSYLASKVDEAKQSVTNQYRIPLINTLKEVSGYEGSEEDPSELVKNGFAAFKTSVENEASDYKTKFENLQKKIDTEEPAAKIVQQQFDQYKADKDQEVLNLSNQLKEKENATKIAVLKSEMAGAYSVHSSKLPDSKHTQELAQMRRDNLERSIEPFEADGKKGYKDGNGNLYQSKQDGHLLSLSEIMDDLLSDLYDSSRKQSGAGSGKGDGAEEGIQLPEDVKSRVGLTKYLVNEKKLDPNTPEFTKVFMEYTKEFPSLPINDPQ